MFAEQLIGAGLRLLLPGSLVAAGVAVVALVFASFLGRPGRGTERTAVYLGAGLVSGVAAILSLLGTGLPPWAQHALGATGLGPGLSGLAAPLVAIWALGFGVALVRLAGAAFALRRVLRAAEALAPGHPAVALLDTLRGDDARPVRLLLSERVLVPFTVGVLRPSIVIPPAALSWDNDRLRLVLLHELAHVRRHDPLALLALRTVACPFWFHPPVRLLVRRFEAAAERAADDMVLRDGAPAVEYAHQLVGIAALSRGEVFRFAPGFSGERHDLEGRLHAILHPGGRRPGSRMLRIALATILIATTTAAGAALASPACPGSAAAAAQQINR